MLLKRYFLLILGFTIISYGVSLQIHVNYVGVEPWNAVNIGLSNLGMTFGFWNALIQVIFILLTIVIERSLPKFGTFLNMIIISSLVDFFTLLNYLPPIPEGFYSYLFYIFSVLITSIGASMAIASNLGSGAKTQFYVAIHQKTNIKLSHSKYLMEFLGLFLAFLVGGPIFIGTLLFVIFSGYFVGFFTPIFINKLEVTK